MGCDELFPSSKWKLVETRTFEDRHNATFSLSSRSTATLSTDPDSEEKAKFDSIEDAVNALRRGNQLWLWTMKPVK